MALLTRSPVSKCNFLLFCRIALCSSWLGCAILFIHGRNKYLLSTLAILKTDADVYGSRQSAVFGVQGLSWIHMRKQIINVSDNVYIAEV